MRVFEVEHAHQRACVRVRRTVADPAEAPVVLDQSQDGALVRYRFNVRTFAFTELRDWLLQAGFARVKGCGPRGEPLALDSARMIVLASV